MTIRALDMKTVSADGKWVVSTVALMDSAIRTLDAFFNPEYLSDAFETMVFRADADGKVADFGEHYREGYGDIGQAELGHKLAVAALNAGQLDLY